MGVETALAAMTDLRSIDVPWDRGVRDDDDQIGFWLHFRLDENIAPHLGAIWESVQTFSPGFDSISIDYGGHQPLEEDALAMVKRGMAKNRSSSVIVYRKNAPKASQLCVFRRRFDVVIPHSSDFDIDAWLAWLFAFLERLPATTTVLAPFLHLAEGPPLGPHREMIGWLMSFTKTQRELYAREELERPLEGVRILSTKSHLFFLTSAGPDQPPPESQREALQAKLTRAAL
jgi:hypothetical protein